MIGQHMRKELYRSLLDHRYTILNNRQKQDTSWKELNQRETEMEEYASKRTMARRLESLNDINNNRLDMIEDALFKMTEDLYGICDECGNAIPVKRLRVVPWARYCIHCAEKLERSMGGQPSSQTSSRYTSMSDTEITDLISEEIDADDRIDAEKITISSRDGIIYLNGLLPDKKSRQDLLETIEDVFEFEEIVDNIRIAPEAFGLSPPDEAEDIVDNKKDDDTILYGEKVEDDMTAAIQNGTPIMPPSELIPEKM